VEAIKILGKKLPLTVENAEPKPEIGKFFLVPSSIIFFPIYYPVMADALETES